MNKPKMALVNSFFGLLFNLLNIFLFRIELSTSKYSKKILTNFSINCKAIKLIFISSLFFPYDAFAEVDVQFFNLVYENDIFYQEDGGYTNGIALNYARGFDALFSKQNTPSVLLPIIKWSGFNKDEDRLRGISYQFSQVMSTPEDIQTSDLIEDQQPYAGLLMGRINFHALDLQGSRRLGFILGVVGPLSGTEQSQKFIHSLTGSDKPQGWHHQLKTEPIIRLETARAKKLWHSNVMGNLESEISSFGEGGIGNLYSNVSFGMRWRLGRRLKDVFPVAMDLPGREINPTAGMLGSHWAIFFSLEGIYKFNDILIEGNTYRKSHGVDLIHEQARVSYGFSFDVSRWAFTYTGALSSKEYDTQPGVGKFGSFSITYKLK